MTKGIGLVLVLTFFMGLVMEGRGQGGDFHNFANKDGQAIEAKIVSLTPDWKTMTIQRRDGRSFEMQVNVLTLDDQQLVKEWIAANPKATAMKFELDVSFVQKEDTTERKRDEYYRYTAKDVTYTISVRNKSRADLVGAKVEYVIIVEDGVRFYRDEITGDPDYYGSDDNPEEKLVTGSSEVTTTLAFNHVHEFVTKPAKEETVKGDGGATYGADKIIGALARVLDRDGAVIGEYRSGETTVRNRTWEKTVGGGGIASNNTMSDDSSDDRSRPSPTPSPTSDPSMVGDIDVRELDEMPATLKKGDSVRGGASPQIGGKSIYITAKIDIDERNPNGVILAHGGAAKGYSLFIYEGKLHFWVKKAHYSGSVVRSVEISLAGLPTTPFVLGAEFTPQRLALKVNDQLRKTADSFDHFETNPQEGLTVGFDGGDSPVGPAAANEPFPGEIEEVRIRLTD